MEGITIKEFLEHQKPYFIICCNAYNNEINEGHTFENRNKFSDGILNCSCFNVFHFGYGKVMIEYYL